MKERILTILMLVLICLESVRLVLNVADLPFFDGSDDIEVPLAPPAHNRMTTYPVYRDGNWMFISRRDMGQTT